MSDPELYKQELIKSFHQQFAENQNNHQKTFVQFLSIILTVIVGFGYAYLKYDSSIDENNLEILDFTAIFSAAEGILTLGFCLVLSYAYGFRRDQLVNAIIREKAGITEDKATNDKWKIFPVSYNPREGFKDKKKRFITWMPDFHVIFSTTFFVLQLMLMLLYFSKWINRDLFCELNKLDYKSFIVFIIGFGFIVTSICISRIYFKKIRELYKQKYN